MITNEEARALALDLIRVGLLRGLVSLELHRVLCRHDIHIYEYDTLVKDGHRLRCVHCERTKISYKPAVPARFKKE